MIIMFFLPYFFIELDLEKARNSHAPYKIQR